MFSIEQTPLLHALGYALGNSLWQMSLLWLVYIGLTYNRRWNSSQRYLFAVGAASAGFLWFAVTFLRYAFSEDVRQATAVISVNAISLDDIAPSGRASFIYHSMMASLRSLAPYFSCAYLFVMLVLGVRLANGFKQVKQLRTESLSKAPVDWRLFIQKHAKELGIEKQVKIFISGLAHGPLTIGFWKPFILVPIASINQLSTEQVEAILLHELAHIKRYDYLVNIMLQLAEIFLFFNPFMRLLLKQARLERENSCDDYVLQFQYNAAEYAKALLAIEQTSTESLLALGSNNKNEFQLLHRIKRMVAPERRSFNYRQQLGLLFLVTFLGLSFTIISTPKKKTEEPIKTQLTTVKLSEPKTETKQAETVPAPVDIVVDLKQIKNIAAAAVKQDEVKQLVDHSIAAATSGDFDAHVKEIEKSAEAIHKSTTNALAMNSPLSFSNKWDWNNESFKENIENGKWLQAFAPVVMEKPEQVFAMMIPGFVVKDENGIVYQHEPSSTDMTKNAFAAIESLQGKTVKTAKEMELLQKKLQAEQKRVELARVKTEIMQDSSIHRMLAMGQQSVAQAQVRSAKLRKEAAIAPFRVDVKAVNDANQFYSYNTTNDKDEDEVAANMYGNAEQEAIAGKGAIARNLNISKPRTSNGRNTTVYFSNQDCDCPQSNKQGKSITIINGKALSEKVKSLIDETKQLSGSGITEELRTKVLHELETELKGLENLEIKSRITTNGATKNKSIVIEVEASF